MRRRKNPHRPNCTVCDLGPSRFLAFRARQREVEAEYGFRLGVRCRTQEQKEGRRRYMSDWQHRYRQAHREEIAAYRSMWLERRREAKRRERDARRAELLARKDEQRAAWEERRRAVKEKYGFDLGTVPMEMSPEEAKARRRYARDQERAYRETHKEAIRARAKAARVRAKRKAELRRISLANLEKAWERQRELKAQREVEAKEAKRRALEARRELARTKYGFTLGRKPATPEEADGRRRYLADLARVSLETARARAAELARRRVERRRMRMEKAEEGRAEKRRQREATKAALAETKRNAREAFAAEREANRTEYLAVKAEREERGTENRTCSCAVVETRSPDIPVMPSFIIPPVEPPDDNPAGPGTPDDDEGREEAERAARKAQEAEREARRKARAAERLAAKQAQRKAREAEAAERETLLEQARAAFPYKLRAFEKKKETMRRRLGLPAKRQKWTPEQARQWEGCLRDSQRELDDWLVARMRKALDKAARAARREQRRLVAEGKAAPSAEQVEREKRKHDREAAYYREYRRRKREEALAEAQAKWTSEQWAEWERRQAAKERYTPAWLVGEVVRRLASEYGVGEDDVTARLIESGGIDFLVKGAESMGRRRLARRGTVAAAVRALMFHLDPDHASLFGR